MTEEQLREIEARAQDATPGQWWWLDTSRLLVMGRVGGMDVVLFEANGPEETASNNVAFAIAARRDVPALIAAVRERDATIAEVKRRDEWTEEASRIIREAAELLKPDVDAIAERDAQIAALCEELAQARVAGAETGLLHACRAAYTLLGSLRPCSESATVYQQLAEAIAEAETREDTP